MWTEVWYDDCCESGISDWICSFVLHHLQKSNKMNKLANSLNMTIPHHAPQAERFQAERFQASPLHRAAAETFQFRLDLSGKFDEEFAIFSGVHTAAHSHTSVMDRLSRALLKGPSAVMAAGRRVIKDQSPSAGAVKSCTGFVLKWQKSALKWKTDAD